MDSQQPSDGASGTVPANRYGPGSKSWRDRFRPGTRKALIAIPLAVVLGLLGFLMYTNLGSESIEADRTSFRQVSEQAMELNMRVRRDDPDSPAVCVVRTRALNGVESGRREVLVPAGQSEVTTVIRGNAKPVTASIIGCGYGVPSYMSAAVRPKE